MNLDELRSVQAKERRKDSLQHLRDAFYDDVAAYIADLRAARDRRAEQVEKPFSDDDVRRMSDEIETAEEVAEALYERRVGKVVKLASFAAADMPVESEGMTSQERELFDDLVSRIGENKSAVLDVLAGDAPPTQGDAPPMQDNPSTEPDDSADVPPSIGSSASDASEPHAPDDPESHTPDDPESHAPDDASESEAPDARESDASHAPESSADVLPGAASSADVGPSGRRPTGDGGGYGSDDEVDSALADAMGTPTVDEEPSAEPDGRGPIPPDESAEDVASEDASDDAVGDGVESDGPVPVEPEPAPPGATGIDAAPEADRTAGSGSGSGSNAASETDESIERSGEASSEASNAGTSQDRTTVRITADVGEIFGIDEREYDLASEDVVTLPSANAEPLVRRDAAERLD